MRGEIQPDSRFSEELGRVGGGWAVRGEVRASFTILPRFLDWFLKSLQIQPTRCTTEFLFEIFELFCLI